MWLVVVTEWGGQIVEAGGSLLTTELERSVHRILLYTWTERLKKVRIRGAETLNLRCQRDITVEMSHSLWKMMMRVPGERLGER